MTGEEDRYSKLDLWSIDANVEGSAKIVDMLRPILTKLDPTYLAKLDAAYATVDGDHREVRRPTRASRPSTRSAPTTSRLLQAGLANLSELLAELPGRLGLAAVGAGPCRAPRTSRAAPSSPARPPSATAAVAGGVRWRSALALGDRAAGAGRPVPGYIPFDGAHQAGIVTPSRPQTAAIFVALDAVVASNRSSLTTLAELTRGAASSRPAGRPTPATRSIRRPRAGSSARPSARPT